jgi:CHAT domain-containing protein/Tfp pilus assembly protein PilF
MFKIVSIVCAVCVISSSCAFGQLKPGIVIESVAKGSAGDEAGLQKGDVLLRWTRGNVHGEINSPFDLMETQLEQSARGVTLEGQRANDTRSWKMGPKPWTMSVRPNLPEKVLTLYLQGEDLANSGKPDEAAERWQAASREAQKSSPGADWLAAWFFYHQAGKLNDARQWKQADESYQQAVQQTADARISALIYLVWASNSRQRDSINAEKRYRQGLAAAQKISNESVMIAALLNGLGYLAKDRDPKLAEDDARKALAIYEKLAPDSLALGTSLVQLSLVLIARGDLDAAEDCLRRSAEIHDRLAPGSNELSDDLHSLGIVNWMRGDLPKSNAYYLQALAIRERVAPGSLGVAGTLQNLSNNAYDSGDMAKAEEYGRKSLGIKEKLAPESLVVANTLNGLGDIALLQGDLGTAENYYNHALAIKQKTAPQSITFATTLGNLGQVALQADNLAKAQLYFQQVLDIVMKQAPDSYYAAGSLEDLGEAAKRSHDLEKAKDYYTRALAMRQQKSPDSIRLAFDLNQLADVSQQRGDLDQAETLYRQAEAILEKKAPVSPDHADSLAGLAGVLRRKQQLDHAGQLFEQALSIVDNEIGQLGGASEAAGFRARWDQCYKDYIDVLVEQKQPALAFQVLERSRAQAFLELLSAGRVDIRKGVEASLLEREQTLERSLAVKSNRRLQLLNDKHTDDQVAAYDREIADLLAEYHDVEKQLRTSSPAYSALRHPQPLDLRQIQKELLDENTLLLEYSLGDNGSYVFAVTTDTVESFKLTDRATIENAARHLYEILKKSGNRDAKNSKGSSGDHGGANLDQAAAVLSRMVLLPVAGKLEHKRLLIVGDGVLQYIPFAVLPDPKMAHPHTTAAATPPLIAEHEIVDLPSASVLTALRQAASARRTPPETVAVLADPVFEKSDDRVAPRTHSQASTDSTPQAQASVLTTDKDSASNRTLTRSLADFGSDRAAEFHLSRLPYTRREAQGIMSLTPAGDGMQALDFDASRSTATSAILAQYRIVHFATHGLLDSEHPELSGLVLSLVDHQGNEQEGFLGLREIYNLNLPADLVVLSACETGLGKDIRGEGLLGLTRGFMYSGASRVLASLWEVDDEGTAELMKKFYGEMLSHHQRPAQALRNAQIWMRLQKRWQSPYYWAGFKLQGEWQ